MSSRRLVRAFSTFVLSLALAPTVFAQLPPPGEPPLSADVQLDDVGGAERSHLDTIDAFLADQQWDEAVETLRRLMENEGDKLIAANGAARYPSGEFVRFIPLREFCQMRLARMATEHPEALALYRRRVDPLAKRWFDEGAAGNDADLLTRVVREMFASSYGDDALNALGEILLERGDFVAARNCWQRIHARFFTPAMERPPVAVPPGLPWWPALQRVDVAGQADLLAPLFSASEQLPPEVLCYPDSNLNPADMWARLVLTSILEGSPRRAETELALLRLWFPEATGRIAGRDGKYAELLAAMLRESRDWSPLPRDEDWQTFAGNDRRNKVAGQQVDIALRPLWTAPLAPLSASTEIIGEGRPRVSESADALLSYHPVVCNGVLFVNEFSRIRAFDTATGKPWPQETMQSGIFDTKIDPAMITAVRGDFVGVPRSTLTVFGQRLYARMGSPITGRVQPDEVLSNARSYLVGLDLNAEGRLLPGFPIRLDGADWRYWEFEGSPLADAANTYVVMRYRDNVNAKLRVVCFDSRTGVERWRSPMIVAADSVSHGMRDELTHTLLSRDHDRLYLNSNLGVIGCVRATDGAIEWITRYPRSSFRTRDPDDSDRHFFRDLNPCVVAGDLVIVAPADCDRIFALRAATGQVVWATGTQRAADAVHLLGTGQGNLIVGGDYLYWFDVESGQPVGQFPYPGTNEPGHARPEPRGFGRGVLAGTHVYWPTRDALYVFEQATRRTAAGWEPVGTGVVELSPRGTSGGNLLLADGKLFIVTADQIAAFDEYGPSSSR